MKARVMTTGEIVDIIRNSAFDKDVFYDSNGQKYNREELSFDFKEKSFPKDDDYWTRLEHQYTGQFMQAMISCSDYINVSEEAMADASFRMAHALVEKLKEKEERK